MHDENESDARSETFAFGDAGAGKVVDLPSTEIRKLRNAGLLEGSYAKIGHRSILFHISRLRQRVNAVLASGGIRSTQLPP